MNTAPFTKVYRETARHPDNARTLNELGEYFTTRALVPYRKRVGGVTRKGKREVFIGERM